LIIMKDVAGELERRASNRRKLITAWLQQWEYDIFSFRPTTYFFFFDRACWRKVKKWNSPIKLLAKSEKTEFAIFDRSYIFSSQCRTESCWRHHDIKEIRPFLYSKILHPPEWIARLVQSTMSTMSRMLHGGEDVVRTPLLFSFL
jgi:hypothetical protein